MTNRARPKQSRSLRFYARLLKLYPPAFLQRHRAEMLYYLYGPTRGDPALQVFGGCLVGMVAMYIATRVYGMP